MKCGRCPLNKMKDDHNQLPTDCPLLDSLQQASGDLEGSHGALRDCRLPILESTLSQDAQDDEVTDQRTKVPK